VKDPVDESSSESFPASDPPSWEPLHAGEPEHARGTGAVIWPVVKSAVIGVLFLYLWGVLLARWVTPSERWEHPSSAGVTRVIALAVMGAGVAIMFWCVAEFAIYARGTPLPLDPPKRLTVRGLYRYVRNPMYVGALIALLGEALYFGAWQIVALAAAAFAAVNVFIVFYEEPQLARRFGADYEAYKARVNRWIPKF
jgi:protein-S-isoprenylcysteine O-methyltransferase Ste14